MSISLSLYIYIYVYMYVYLSLSIYIYIYICISICPEEVEDHIQLVVLAAGVVPGHDDDYGQFSKSHE